MNPDQPVQPPQPMSPPPPQQPSGSDQYDFINNPTPKSTKSKFSFSGGSSKLKILAIGLAVFTVFVMIFSLLFSGGGGDAEALLVVAKKQNQIIALAKIGTEKSGSVKAQNLAVASYQTLQTDQNQTLSLIEGNGKKVKLKEYASAPDGEVVSELTKAATNGRFDEAFTNNMKTALEDYQTFLKTNITLLKGPIAKQSMANYYENAGLLLESIVR